MKAKQKKKARHAKIFDWSHDAYLCTDRIPTWEYSLYTGYTMPYNEYTATSPLSCAISDRVRYHSAFMKAWFN